MQLSLPVAQINVFNTVGNCYQSAKRNVLFQIILKVGMVEGLDYNLYLNQNY